MKAKISMLALWACLALLLIMVASLTATALEPEGIITVCPPPGAGCDYTVIQEAIDNADPGDTIRVAQGVYTENLTVDKLLTLEGGYESSGWTRDIALYETIIDGSNSRTVVGDWDGGGVRYPAVINDGGTYKMWYVGRDLYDIWRIGYATSSDGLTWAKYASYPVLDVGADGEWDAAGFERLSVIEESPTSYKMWYSGRAEDDTWRIGYATSSDGIQWAKYASNPVLDLGDETWNNRMIIHPHVIYEDNLYKMWLHTAGDDGSGWIPYMSYATSIDGIAWTWDANNPLLSRDATHDWESEWIWGPSVLHQDSVYQMWYSGGSGDEGSTGYATSVDEITWTKYNGGVTPVLSGTPGEWDEGDAYDPFVLYASGTYTMYYDSDTAIGVATSTDGINWNKAPSNPVLESGTPGQWGQPVVTFTAGSDSSILDGFTVRNGEAQQGGGILVDGIYATIRNSTVRDNIAHETGGGVMIRPDSRAVVESNRILSNSVPTEGGSGIYINSSAVELASNLIAHNACTDYEHGNGAIGIDMDGLSLPVTLTNNAVVSNTDKGIMVSEGVHDLMIVNNTIASNRNEGILAWGTISITSLSNNIIASQGYCGIAGADGADFQHIDHNDVWQNGGGDGNYCDYFDSVNPPGPGPNDISEDPLFVDAANGDYHLQIGSPCIDAGTPDSAPATDIEGTPRDAVPDMGAYEWHGVRVYLPIVLKNHSAGHHVYGDNTTSATPSSNPGSYIATGYNAPYATPRSIEIHWPLSSDITSSTVGLSTFKFWGKRAGSAITHLHVNGHDIGSATVGTEYGWCILSFNTAYLDQGDNNVIEIWTSSGSTYVASDAPEGDDIGQPNAYYIRNNGGTAEDWGPGYGKIYAQLTTEWSDPGTCFPLYSDDFEDPSTGWSIVDNASVTFGYLAGEYQIRLKNALGAGWVTGPLLAPGDYVVEADMRYATPVTGTAGLVFDAQDVNHDYYFALDSNGSYSLWKWSSSWTSLVDWTSAPGYRPYPQTNRLKVARDGDTISLYLNDQFLISVSDSAYYGGPRLGFRAMASSWADVDVRFDNLRVYPIECHGQVTRVQESTSWFTTSDMPLPDGK